VDSGSAQCVPGGTRLAQLGAQLGNGRRQPSARHAWRNGAASLGERTLAEEVPVAFSYVRRETEGEFRPARGDIPFSAVRGSGLSPIALLLVD
jgi:hypothetical protein